MNTKIIAMIVVGAVVISGGSFFAGIKYQGKKESSRPGNSLTMEQGGSTRMGQNGAGMRTAQTGGMTMGEVLSKDEASITVKLLDGGSKIVFFSESTTITKSAAGSSADLVVSENVVVNGSMNLDGSINAESIQLVDAFQRPTGGQPPAMPVR